MGEDGLLYKEYSRPARSAISEFALGQTFYADGRQVRIDRLDIGKDDLSTWVFCRTCSHVVNHVEKPQEEKLPGLR